MDGNNDKQRHLVIFEPSGRRGYIPQGKTIMEAAQELGVDLQSVCGGRAICGKCKVMVQEGAFSKAISPIEGDEEEFFRKNPGLKGYRLACKARIYGDVVVFVPAVSQTDKLIVAKRAKMRTVEIKPAVRKYYARLSPASLDDSESDWERLQAALNKQYGLIDLKVDYHVLRDLQQVIRQGNWQVTVSVWMNKEVIKVEAGVNEKSFGLAIDVGTTTVAGYLCDLTTGEVVATESKVNPQVIYGEDVMSRITYAMDKEDGVRILNETIIEGLNKIINSVALQAGIKYQDILDMVFVGNTCMHHLFLGINTEYLGLNPFVAAVHHSLDVKARDLGINLCCGAYVHLLPTIAGFVGADTVGVLLAEQPYNKKELTLIIDIGTNGELVLGNRERLICSSCATGPAFEGANIRHGTRALPGAIEKIKIDPDSREVLFKVIGKEGWSADLETVEAIGICGSGIIDAIAQMFIAGIIRKDGRFNTNLRTPRLRLNEDGASFVIAWAHETSIGQDIVIYQEDVRAVQLAKGALYAAAKIMMRQLGVKKLDRVVLAGAFGSLINKESAAIIGLFPDCDLDDVYAVGNAAGDGACLALLNSDKRKEAGEAARKVEYMELTVQAGFEREFAKAMYFPHMDDLFPHLKKVLREEDRDKERVSKF